jgi:hypothetical protein
MSLVSYAQRELELAGWFKEDSDYAGMVGPAVVKMVEQFAEEGHSGYSAGLCLALFKEVAAFKPLSPITNPLDTGDFHDVSGPSGTPKMTTLQSTRLSSLFSEDGGETWYDIDKPLPRWHRLLIRMRFPISRRSFVTFPYLPGRGQ